MAPQLSLFDLGMVKVGRDEARAFYDQHHYLGGCGNAWSNYAQYKDGLMVACVSFGLPASPNVQRAWFNDPMSERVYELTRLAIITPMNASSFVSQSIKAWVKYRAQQQQRSPRALISYADTAAGHHGGVYQSMSWLYCGKSEPTKGYIDSSGSPVHRRSNGININKLDAKRLGLIAVRTGTKYRYVKLLGSKSQKRNMLNNLRFKIETYPKPDHACKQSIQKS